MDPKHVPNLVLAIRWGVLALAVLFIMVLELPRIGLGIAVFGLLFSVAMRFERFRFWLVGKATGYGTQTVADATHQTRQIRVSAAAGGANNTVPAPVTQDPAPLPEAEIARLVEDHRQTGVLLKRHWPLGTPASQNSWLGGLPNLPDGVDWPENPDTGFALHHLAQIDLAEMPDLGAAQTLPRKGMMWFFADIDEEMCWDQEAGHASSRILYHPDSTAGQPQRPAPENLPQVDHPLRHLESPVSYRGVRPRVFARWPVTGHVAPVWDIDKLPDGVGYASGYFEAMEAAQAAARADIMGPVVTPQRGTVGPFRDSSEPMTADPAYNPVAQEGRFPHCGALAKAMTHILLERMTQQLSSARVRAERERATKPEQAQEHVETVTRFEPLVAATQQLKSQLIDAPDFEALSAPRQAAFDDVMRSVTAKPLLGIYPDQLLRRSVTQVVATTFDRPELLSGLPASLIEVDHHALLPSHDYAQHTLMSPRTAGSNPTPGNGVRLAQFDSDYALGMMFCDVGIIDFWIDPDDLAAGNWHRAWAGTAG